MAQLVERLLLTPEVRGSITLIGILNITFMLTAVLERRKKKKKRPGMASRLEMIMMTTSSQFLPK